MATAPYYYGPMQTTQYGYSGTTPVMSTPVVGQYSTPTGGMSIAPSLITSAPTSVQQPSVLGVSTVDNAPATTKQQQPTPSVAPSTSTAGTSGGGTSVAYGPAGLADQQIQTQQDLFAQQQAVLEGLKQAKIATIGGQYESAQKQYDLAGEAVGREYEASKANIEGQKALSEQEAGLTLSQSKQNIEALRGRTGREAEIAKEQLRKSVTETTRQARVRARALGASASSDFLNIMSAIETEALSGQGEISQNLIDAMTYYDQQAIGADQQYSQFKQELELNTTNAVTELDNWRRTKIDEIAANKESSRIDKENMINEINAQTEASIVEAMSDYTNKVTAIEQWRAELEIQAQQEASRLAAAKQSPLELARAEAMDMLASGQYNAGDVTKLLSTKYGVDIGNQALQGYYSAGGKSPEEEELAAQRITNAQRYLTSQGITEENPYQYQTITPYKPTALESLFTKDGGSRRITNYGPTAPYATNTYR